MGCLGVSLEISCKFSVDKWQVSKPLNEWFTGLLSVSKTHLLFLLNLVEVFCFFSFLDIESCLLNCWLIFCSLEISLNSFWSYSKSQVSHSKRSITWSIPLIIKYLLIFWRFDSISPLSLFLFSLIFFLFSTLITWGCFISMNLRGDTNHF